MDIKTNNNWYQFDQGNTIGSTGPEDGTIIYDIEHIQGARITLEKDTSIAPFGITLGIYGLMFHTRYKGDEQEAKSSITRSAEIIESVLQILNTSENNRDKDWKDTINNLMDHLTEQ